MRKTSKGYVSLADVARLAGVSISTVSRIANGEFRRASPEMVERVRKIIAESGYTPNPVGRSLRGGGSRLVAMLIPNLDNPAMAAIAASTEVALRQHGFVMILCDTHDRADLQDEYLRAMRSRFVEGLVMVSTVPSPELAAAVSRGDAMVFVNRRSPFGGGAFVGIDNRRAGESAADIMSAWGIRRPAILQPTILSGPIHERIEGFSNRFQQMNPGVAVPCYAGAGANHLENGYAAAAQMAARGDWPDGVLCPSDLMAYGLCRAADESGVMMPHACRAIGIDGNPLNRWIAPWLTSIRIPYEDFGAAIVQAFLRLKNGEPGTETLLDHSVPYEGAAHAAPS